MMAWARNVVLFELCATLVINPTRDTLDFNVFDGAGDLLRAGASLRSSRERIVLHTLRTLLSFALCKSCIEWI